MTPKLSFQPNIVLSKRYTTSRLEREKNRQAEAGLYLSQKSVLLKNSYLVNKILSPFCV